MRASAATATFSLTLRAVDSRASFWLEPGGQLWVGRHPTNDVVIDGPAISRFHASIRWDADAEIVLICRSGARSGRAAGSLARAGFTRVMNMTGGMLAWNAAQLPVER